MRSFVKGIATTLALGVGMAATANASEVLVTSDISVSTTWTANNTYNLQGQIYVLPGATLTIDAGTVVASTTNGGGSLAVTKGGQIYVNGTAANPVIMTSKADVATWTGGDPHTGTWRETALEWGNLTICGGAYISANNHGNGTTNTPVPSASNVYQMEGLTEAFPGDTRVLYGGGNDDDNSGGLHYLSIRYGGKVVSLNNELNGLSMGGIGRMTDVDHIDIMNNVDDGIETWGGTVNYKYINIWNIGDDSFDFDEGWRGKAQFVLIVQGYSLNAAQGSGVGDNCFETDGAEDSDWQPVTTGVIYNATAIGQPVDGDQGTAWRDNCRLQYHNCIWMDLGEELVKFDNIDGDGGSGYGFNGTLSWPDTWTTPYTTTSTVNAPANPADFYKSQTSGNLAEITDSVFFRNLFANAYTEATARGVFNAANDNVLIAGSNAADAPIMSITRGPAVVRGGKTMLPVVGLDPRPMNAATASVGTAPNDGFFTQANYRGAFAPNQPAWVCGWTAAAAFGFLEPKATVTQRTSALNLPNSLTTNGLPTIGNSSFALVADNPSGTCGVVPGWIAAVATTVQGPLTFPLPHYGCSNGPSTLLINPILINTQGGLYLGGPVSLATPIPSDPGLCGLSLSSQAAFLKNGQIRLGNAVDWVIGND